MEGDREAAKHMDVLDSADAEEKEVAQALTGTFVFVVLASYSIVSTPFWSNITSKFVILIRFVKLGGASHNNFAHGYFRSETLSHPAMRRNQHRSSGDVTRNVA